MKIAELYVDIEFDKLNENSEPVTDSEIKGLIRVRPNISEDLNEILNLKLSVGANVLKGNGSLLVLIVDLDGSINAEQHAVDQLFYTAIHKKLNKWKDQ